MLLLLFITTKFDLMYLLFYMPSIVRLVTSGGGKWHSAAQTTTMSSRMGTRLIGTVFFRMTTTSFVHLPAQHGFWHWPLSLFWQSFCCCSQPELGGGISSLAQRMRSSLLIVKLRSARMTSPGSIRSRKPDLLTMRLSDALPPSGYPTGNWSFHLEQYQQLGSVVSCNLTRLMTAAACHMVIQRTLL